MREVRAHEIYRHFKGKMYQICEIATHTETGEQLVIYQALYGDFRFYARPLDMFLEKVDHEKYPETSQVYRFEKVEPGEIGESADLTENLKRDETQNQVEIQNEADASVAEAEIGRKAVAESAHEQEEQLDPLVLEFLDAKEYEQKLNILAALRHRITDDMINTMAICCDVEVPEGDIEERYESLKSCLVKKARYECKRIR